MSDSPFSERKCHKLMVFGNFVDHPLLPDRRGSLRGPRVKNCKIVKNWCKTAKVAKPLRLCIKIGGGTARRPVSTENASCCAAWVWPSFVHRHGGFEQNSCTREREAFNGSPPKWSKVFQFLTFLGPRAVSPTTGRTIGPDPWEGVGGGINPSRRE